MEENNQLADLISQIKHISLNNQDLMQVSLEYSNRYFKSADEETKFEQYWKDPLFREQVINSAREAIVLAMQAITLDEKIPFNIVVEKCVDLKAQRYNELNINDSNANIGEIKKFLSFLRKELFSRIYSQNKDLQKVSKIPKIILNSRYEYFMAHQF